ncbi:MAG: TonB-dependent receptor [Woeseiaceae bacterium]|nr:TonB-dependent receptor [Woeseiaceae bacterium]
MKSINCAVLAALLGAPLAGFAADISASDTIVVTATRNEISIDDAIVPVSVITRSDIELSLATDLAELLRFEAGIDLGRNGGPGQATSVFIRGAESNHTLVLVDGVRVNPGTIGGAALQHIAPEMIERVEIVKGARSALFGTDAIGGVINVITRRADDSFVDATLGAGSFDSRSANVSAGLNSDAGEFGLAVNWQDTDGFAPRLDSDIETGYDNLTVNLYGARQFGASEVSLRHWRAEGNVEYLDFFLAPVDQDYENLATALQVDTQLGDQLVSKLVVSHMVDDIRQNQSPDFVESSRVSLDWQLTRAFDVHTLTGGIYVVDENAQALSFGSGFDEDTDVRAVFIQDQINLDRHRAFVALRLTDHETFGQETTWNAEYAFDLNDNWSINAGLGRAFRAPDASDRFGFGGDPDLDPELSDSAQLGLRYRPANRHSFDFELYANDVEDLIEFDFATFTLVNVDEAEIRGAEIAWEYRGDSFVLRTELNAQEADNADTGERLLRRAERTATLSYVQNVGPHRFGVSLLASGDREDFGGVELDSYVVANLTGQFQLGEQWQLNARIENLFDEEYQTAANFRMQELSGFVELRYRWR